MSDFTNLNIDAIRQSAAAMVLFCNYLHIHDANGFEASEIFSSDTNRQSQGKWQHFALKYDPEDVFQHLEEESFKTHAWHKINRNNLGSISVRLYSIFYLAIRAILCFRRKVSSFR